MLTPQQIDEARKTNGITPVASTPTGAPDRVASMTDAWAAADAKKNDTYLGRVQKNMSASADQLAQHFSDNANSVIGDFTTLQDRNKTEKNSAVKVLNALVFAGHTAGNVAKTAGDIIASSVKTGLSPFSQIKTPEGDTVGQRFSEPVKAAAQKLVAHVADAHPEVVKYISDQAAAHPDIARGISDIVYTYTLKGLNDSTLLGSDIPNIKEVASSMKSDVQSLVNSTKGVGTKAKDLVTKKAGDVVSKVANREVDSTIQAVNPDLTGKKLAGAYQEVVTGGRTAKASGIIKEQSLSPGQQAINIGTRLSKPVEVGDGAAVPKIVLKNKPVQDLSKLADGMKTTEEHIGNVLKGDPTLVYNADKPTLVTALDAIKAKSPREFGSIKDSKALYDDVINFAKEQVSKAEDTIPGLRDARSAFDAAAKKQFPSAFKDGFIDAKNPAGIAIKAARDTINEHLYNTAPEGSVLRQLIQRESDIFKAAQSVAAKAASQHGTSIAGRALDALREHPYLSAIGIYELAKHTVADNLPGL